MKALTMNNIYRIVAKLEAGKSQASFGDTKQTIKLFCKMMAMDGRVTMAALGCGLKQLPKGKK